MPLRPRAAKISALLFFVALAVPLCLLAEPLKQLKPTNYVNDFGEVLDADATQRMNSLCAEIDHKAKAQISVVTIKSLDGADIESYAADLFKQWGIGAKSSNRGVLVLLVVEDRQYRIEVGYGLEPILPDGKVGGFGREAAPALKQGDYSAALQLLVWRIADTIATDAGIELSPQYLPRLPRSEGTEPPESTRPEPQFPVPTSLIIGVVVALVIILGIAGAIGGWGGIFNVLFLILSIFLDSGGRSSGGFGSGGGFGGFGGGSSGGGGASGKW